LVPLGRLALGISLFAGVAAAIGFAAPKSNGDAMAAELTTMNCRLANFEPVSDMITPLLDRFHQGFDYGYLNAAILYV
jgi:hypothetical protein